METYRRGHNETDSKSVCGATCTRVRIPPSPSKKNLYFQILFLREATRCNGSKRKKGKLVFLFSSYFLGPTAATTSRNSQTVFLLFFIIYYTVQLIILQLVCRSFVQSLPALLIQHYTLMPLLAS